VGHLDALEQLGGCPTRHIRYDNLKAAVSRVLFGWNRLESTGGSRFAPTTASTRVGPVGGVLTRGTTLIGARRRQTG
jgi:hypothetical protein